MGARAEIIPAFSGRRIFSTPRLSSDLHRFRSALGVPGSGLADPECAVQRPFSCIYSYGMVAWFRARHSPIASLQLASPRLPNTEQCR
jgi:hypothetical protein